MYLEMPLKKKRSGRNVFLKIKFYLLSNFFKNKMLFIYL